MSQLSLQFETTRVDENQLLESHVAEEVTLRPYQSDSVNWAMERFESGAQSALVVLPTGTGKSVVFTETMRRFADRHNGRILLLAHRRELLTQGIGHSANAGLHGSLEMASNSAARKADVVCASVQTLIAKSNCEVCYSTGKINGVVECGQCRGRGKIPRMERFNPHDFSLVVIDEAHHATAKSYRTIYQWFEQNPNLKHLGVTATPRRADNTGLYNIYESAWDEMPLPSAIADGWLVPIRQQFVKCDSLMLTGLKTRAGDYSDKDIGNAFLGGGSEEEEQQLLHEVAYPIATECDGRRPFILFCATVEHARKTAEALSSYPKLTDRVEFLHGGTKDEERTAIIRRLKSGQSIGLVNCGVATEGFDWAAAEIVAIARPTKSEALYLQMIGRGTRPLKGTVDGPETAQDRRAAIEASAKPFCLVMDFVGASGAIKQHSVGSVLSGLPLDDEDLLAALNRAIAEQSASDMEALISESKEEREEKLRERARKRREAKEREEERLKASGIYAVDGDYTSDAVELFGEKFNAFRDYTPKPGQATQKQVNLLVKLGVTPEKATTFSKRQAGTVIDKMSNKAPVKGMLPNMFAGTCVITGQKVGKRNGWVMKNKSTGKWETYSKSGAESLKRDQSHQGASAAPF